MTENACSDSVIVYRELGVSLIRLAALEVAIAFFQIRLPFVYSTDSSSA